MPYYKDTQNKVHFLDSADYAYLLPPESVEITAEEANALINAVEKAVPFEVTRFQALAALQNAGLLDTVTNYINQPTTPVMDKLAFDNAQSFRRDSPTLKSISTALGMTDQQLDDLFALAASMYA